VPSACGEHVLQNRILDYACRLTEREVLPLIQQHHHLLELKAFLLAENICVRMAKRSAEACFQLRNIFTPWIYLEEIRHQQQIVRGERGIREPQRVLSVMGSQKRDVLRPFSKGGNDELRQPPEKIAKRNNQSGDVRLAEICLGCGENESTLHSAQRSHGGAAELPGRQDINQPLLDVRQGVLDVPQEACRRSLDEALPFGT